MRKIPTTWIPLLVGLIGFASGARAASYQKIDGTIVDPILDRLGNIHAYGGPNLGPGVSAAEASLQNADLVAANLEGSDFYYAFLYQADLTGADLRGADLFGTNLSSAILTSADLTNAYYGFQTTFPVGFDPIAAGMISGTRVINNGLAPPNPANVIDRPEVDFIVNNAGCNAQIEYPCVTPGASTAVSGFAREVSVFETSIFSGTVSRNVTLHDSSTADVIVLCESESCVPGADDYSSLTVQVQAYEAGVDASGSAFVYATGGAWERVSASGNSHLIVTGSEAQGSNFRVWDDALLEIYVDEPWSIYVNGGRAILHPGTRSHVSTAVERGGILEIAGGWLQSDREDQGVGWTGNRISGEMFMSSGGIGPGDFRVDGYAQINDGFILASSSPEYSVPGPWNFSSYGEGLIELSGGTMNEFVSMGARDASRIRLFGSEFAVAGQSHSFGMLGASSGLLSGTLANGDPIDNPFAHRGADCGGQPCTGRILFLAPGLDWDQDSIPNVFDNCAEEPNVDQADSDEDGTGDVCFAPVDLDRDGIVDALDNCRVDANPDQADSDSDGVGDACEKELIFWADKGLEGCTTPPKRLPYENVSSDLGNGDVIDRSAQPCDCFGIEFPVTAGTASVRFLHRSPSGAVEEYCENVAPYALGLGPNQPICADGLDEDGLHELMATPYDAPGCEAGGGEALASSIRSFEIAAPEPGSAVMVCTGALGLAGISRRRASRKV